MEKKKLKQNKLNQTIDNVNQIKVVEMDIKKTNFNLLMLLNEEGGCVALRQNETIHVEVLPDSIIEIKVPCLHQLVPAKFTMKYDSDPVKPVDRSTANFKRNLQKYYQAV